MGDRERSCATRESTDVVCGQLGNHGAIWPVMFGRGRFEKQEALAYARHDCGDDSLDLGAAKQHTDTPAPAE